MVVASWLLQSIGAVGRERPLAASAALVCGDPGRLDRGRSTCRTQRKLFAASTVDCTFLSVGHGCATCSHCPTVRPCSTTPGNSARQPPRPHSVSDFLWSRGRTHIDAVVISHSDIDHYNALPELLRRFSVGAVYVSPIMFDGASAATETLRHAIEQAGVPMREIYRRRSLARSRRTAPLTVLHPPRRGTLGSDNSNSVVLDIEYRGRRFLFPGDLESPGLDELLAETPLDCDVVLAPHHGSMRSDPPGFAAWSTPEWVIISGDSRSTVRKSPTPTARRRATYSTPPNSAR